MDKFLGVGLKRALGLALFTIFIIVTLKVVFTKYEVPGISQVINAV